MTIMLILSLSKVCLCENCIFQEKYKARVLIIDRHAGAHTGKRATRERGRPSL